MTQPVVDPAAPPVTPPAPAPGTTITAPVIQPPPPAPVPSTVTAEDLIRVRREAEESANARLAEERAARAALEQQVGTLTQEREARLAAEQAQADAEAAALEQRRREELSFREALEESQATTQRQIQELTQGIQARDVLLQKEREYGDLMQYRSDRLTAEADHIMPTLTEFVTGNTREEIDAAIEKVKTKTNETVAAMQQASVAARMAAPGVSPTAGPPVGGPLDTADSTRTYSVDELKDMPLGEYAQQRQALLGAASNAYRGKGMFD
jgi:hypothetical protein